MTSQPFLLILLFSRFIDVCILGRREYRRHVRHIHAKKLRLHLMSVFDQCENLII